MVGCTCLWYRLITGYLVQVGAWLMHLFMVQVEVQVDAWFKFLGIGLQRYISQCQVDSDSIILLLLQGGRTGQGQVVVATF
jgi:hypothetical protein